MPTIQPHMIRALYSRGGTTYTDGNFVQGDSVEDRQITPCSVSGTFKNLRVVARSAIFTGSTRTITLRTGSTPTPGGLTNRALSCAFTDPDLDGQDAVNQVHINAGEYWDWKVATSTSQAGDDELEITWDFVPDTDQMGSWSGGNDSNSNHSITRYTPLFKPQANGSAWSGTLTIGDVIATPGTLTRYDIFLRIASPGVGASYRFTVLVSTNGGVSYVAQDGTGGTTDTRLTITGSGSANQVGTWTGSLALAAGAVTMLQIDPIGSPTATGVRVSTAFLHTNPNEINVFGTTLANPTSGSATSYHGTKPTANWNATEANVDIAFGISSLQLHGLRVVVGVDPTPGSVTFALRKGGAVPSGAPTVTINAGSRTGSDPGTPVDYVTGDMLSVRAVSASGSTGATSYSFIASQIIPALLSVTKHVTEIGIDEDVDLDEVTECTGGGDVAEAENPADGVSLATTTAPLYWMEVTLNDGSPATVYRWAQMAIPYGPPKEARVLRFGTLTRALSDIDGGFESATITSELQDIDGTIRAAWVSGTLRGARVDYYCADLATLQAGGDPDRRFRGYISKCEPAGDRTFRLTVEDALTSRLNAIDGQDLQAPTQLIEDNLADLPRSAEFYDRPAPLLFGSITDEFGAWECPWVGTAELDGELLEWFLVSMAVVLTNEAFLAGLGATADVRVQVPPDAFEVGRPYVPGKPGWIEANDWSVRVGRRWTLVAGRADDPAIILAKEGTIPLVVNVCGLVADQSLSSSPNGTVNSPALALLLYANNYLVQDALTDFLPILLDDDVPIFDTDSFQAVHDALVAMADSGYEPAIAGALGGDFQQRSWRDRVAEFCKSFGYDIGINHHGQAILSVLDTTQAGSAFSFTADTILEGSVRFPTRLPVENEVRFVHTENYLTPLGLETPEPERRLPRDTESSRWLSGTQVVRDEASITALGGSPRGRRRSAIQEYTLSRNAAQSAAVAQRRLDLLSPPNGRIEVALSLSIRHGCELELGQVGDVEHWDLPWTGSRRCRVMRLEEDMDGLTIVPTFRDVDELLP